MIPAVLVPMKGGSDMSAPLRFLIRATPHGLAPRITSFSANNLWWCSRLAISDGLQGDRVRVVQTLLFVTGINTLLQSLFGTQLPSVIGGSYAFLIPVMAIMQDSSLAAIPDEHERFLQSMRAIQGAVIVSSSIQIILGYSQLWGIFSRFFSPLGMAPVVALLGFGFFERGFLVVGRCVEVGLPMLILFVVLYQKFSIANSLLVSYQYLKNVQIREIPILERFSLFICIALVWAYAQILTSGGAYNHFVLPLVVNAV
ncbi:nucleobase-ascorbate transporter 2-like [Aegilops tauschii subsp. strangulata]|uniref:Nucleobase-ascorbate transporter 2 n=1 Tax=Aegilops tauschii TaxID=37682 RepID=M8CDB0_AEGTA